MEWKKGGAESIKEIAGDIIWNMAFHLIRRERKAESTLHLAFPRGNCWWERQAFRFGDFAEALSLRRPLVIHRLGSVPKAPWPRRRTLSPNLRRFCISNALLITRLRAMINTCNYAHPAWTSYAIEPKASPLKDD